MGGFIAFLGVVAFVIGVVAVNRNGIPKLHLANRKQGLLVLAGGFVALLVGAAIAGSSETRPPLVRGGTPTPSLSSSASPSPSPSPSPIPAFSTQESSVTRVIDGDTAEMQLVGGAAEDVRFIGADTPERGRPYFTEASAFTTQALAGKNVFLELDVGQRDRFGRLLAYIWLARPLLGDDAEARASLFNAKLLLDGYAQVLTVPPNVKYVDAFTRYQREARDANRGLWGISPSPVPQTSPTSAPPKGNCHPSYPDFCIAPPPPDLNCPDIGKKDFTVRHDVADPDPHGFDRDKDGVGCES